MFLHSGYVIIICVQSFVFSFLLVKYQGIQLLSQMVTLCNILRKHQTVFQSGCIISHSYQQCIRFPISPIFENTMVQHFYAFFLDRKQCLTVVLTCTFLITTRVEYFFMCSLAICFIFFEEIPIQVFGPFLMGHCLTESLKLFTCSKSKSFIKYITYKYFLSSVGVLFSFLMVFL